MKNITTPEQDYLVAREWQLWQDVCKLLKNGGLVTDADLEMSGPPDTPGGLLLMTIQQWGHAMIRSNDMIRETALRT